jgi:sec-independent protein translocase protein TatB
MFGIGGTEFLVIIIVGILVLGPDHLPRIVRSFAKVMSEFRKISTDFQRAMHVEADGMERAAQAPPKKKKKTEPKAPSPSRDKKSEASAMPEPDAVPEPDTAPTSGADAGSVPAGRPEQCDAAMGNASGTAPSEEASGNALSEGMR